MNDETPQYDFNDPDLKAKIDEVKRRLHLPTEEELTPEAVEAQAEAEKEVVNDRILGKDIDWSDYELDQRFAHFYPRAEFIQTSKGFVWVVDVDEFFSATKGYSAPLTKNNPDAVEKDGSPKNLGEFLGWVINGNEGWRIASIIPNGTGLGAVIFQRKVRVQLPDPVLLEKETKTEPVTDAELEEVSKRAEEWHKSMEEPNGSPVVNDAPSVEEQQ